ARATEEAFTQQVTFKNSYRYEEIVWGAKFRPMFDATNMPGVVNINVELVHEYDLKELN
ncbi:MAG: potassium transporter, partial [Runella slithyformis]